MKRIAKIWGALIYILLVASPLAAQINYNNVHFRQLDIVGGLSHNSVNDITQDEEGFMWFATRDGLCRFDGVKMETFHNIASDTTSIRNNYIHSLCYDEANSLLWITTGEGLCCYSPETNSFRNYDAKGVDRLSQLLYSSSGQLFVTSRAGLYRYDIASDSFVEYLLCNKERENVRFVCEDQRGALWIFTTRGIRCYNPKINDFERVPKAVSDKHKSIRGIISLGANKLLLCAKNGADLIYDIENAAISNLPETLRGKYARCAKVDPYGNIWLGTEFGIYVLDRSLQIIKHYASVARDTSGLNDSPIYALYFDRDNNLWCGSYFGGVNYFINGSDRFKIYPFGYTDHHLSGKAVRNIVAAESGHIYIATEDGGVNTLTPNGKIIRGDRSRREFGLRCDNIHSLMLDSRGDIWFGLFLNGVIKYDQKSHKSQYFTEPTGRITSGFCIVESEDGDIWYGCPQGVYRINNNSVAIVNNISTFSMLSVDSTKLWLGSRNDGLLSLDLATHQTTPVCDGALESGYITSMTKDSYGNIWVTTDENGVYRLTTDGVILAHYDKERIKANSAKAIIEDDRGDIWVSTNRGICRIVKSNNNIEHYGIADGLPTSMFNYTAACRDSSGRLYFGTINGMISFDPHDIVDTKPHLKVALTGVWSNSKPITTNGEIKLSHKEARFLRFDYSTINYQYANGVSYMIKIEGLDESWQEMGSQRQIRLSDISSGRYTMRIIASHDGVRWDNSGEMQLRFEVMPPFWASTIAIILYVVMAISLIIFILLSMRQRFKDDLRRRNELDKKLNIERLNQQKQSFFLYVSHDLKTPLTLILTPLQQMIESGTCDMTKLSMIHRNANRMLFLIEELLTFSKIEMKHTNIIVRHGDIMRFVEELSQSFEVVAQERDIDFTISVDKSSEDVWFSPSKIERIIYNLLSNAFKYTNPDDSVSIDARFERVGEHTYANISVKDSGRGIPAEIQDRIFESYFQVKSSDHRSGFGLGLALTKSLVTIHKGTIEVVSEVGVGSEFIVRINVSQSAYEDYERSMEEITYDGLQKYNIRLNERLDLITEDRVANPVSPDQDDTTQRLLIVEDNKDMNEYLCGIFDEEYIVMSAKDGAEALKMVKKEQPDIIISDVMMPVMDGLTLTSHLKNEIGTCHIPIILLTSKTESSDQTEGYISGADAYIPKPFNTQNLKLLAKNMVVNRARNIERFKQTENLNIKQITYNTRDEAFMKQLLDLIHNNISNDEFGVAQITDKMKISRTMLHTKIKSLTNNSITQFIRLIKMRKAKSYLEEGMNVSESSFAIGIPDPNYFTKCFKKEYNLTPSQYIKQLEDQNKLERCEEELE